MRAFPLALTLLLPAWAGCFAAEVPEGVDPQSGPTLPTGLLLHTPDGLLDPGGLPGFVTNLTHAWLGVGGMDAREPTLAVGADGALYYAARDYSGGKTPPVSATQTPVMKSTDGGATWTDVSPRLPTGDREPPRSGDPMIWLDPFTQRLFQIELYDLVCNWLVYTDDGGKTWTSNPKACSTPVVDHQTIAAGPPKSPATVPVGYDNVVYVCVNQLVDSHCSRSLDGGRTFSTWHLVYPGMGVDCGAGGLHGHVMVAPDGSVFLPREYCGKPYVAVSRDDGLTWERMPVADVEAADQDPNMAYDAAGNLYYLFVGRDQLPYLVVSRDGGASWSAPVKVSPPDITGVNLPTITAGAEGRVALAYVGTRTPLPTGGENEWDNVTWDAYVAVTLDALSEAPVFATQQANPQGDPIYRGDCTGRRCGLLREFIDIAIAPDDTIYVAFVDGCVEDCVEGEHTAGGNANVAQVARLAGAPMGVAEASSMEGGAACREVPAGSPLCAPLA